MTCACKEERKRIERLLDGREVCSCSEEFRHECEARGIYAMRLDKRRERLKKIGEVRGMDARQRLEATILKIHELARARR